MLIGGSSSSGSTPSQRSDGGPIGLDQVPETVDDQRRVRLVCLQQPGQRLAQRPHHLPVEGLLEVGRREAAGEQQAVALGDRQVEVLCEVDEELAARAGPAGLDEAHVLGGQVGVQRQLHLREPPLGAPEADELTGGLRLRLGLDRHQANRSAGFTSEVIDARVFVRDRYRYNQRSQEVIEMAPTTNAEELAERYNAVWMEPDAERRRKGIAAVWSEDAIHLLQPTQEVYAAAAERAVNPTWQVRGHDELEARVTSAYEDFVASGQMSFRTRPGARRLGDVVTWSWEGVSPDGEVLGVGLEFVILAADGRIATDYQFVE